MRSQFAELLNENEYDEDDNEDIYSDYKPHKMTKREFVHEMLRLQEERSMYSE